MAVEEEHLLRVLTDFRDDLARHRDRLEGRVDEMERAYGFLSREVAGRAADEFLHRSRRSREAFAAYDDAVRDITVILGERIDALPRSVTVAIDPLHVLRFLEQLEQEMQLWAQTSHQLVAAADVSQGRTEELVAAAQIQAQSWTNRVVEDAAAVATGLATAEAASARARDAHEAAHRASEQAERSLESSERVESSAHARYNVVLGDLHRTQGALAQARWRLASRQAELNQAQQELAQAIAALEACRAQPPDQNGNRPTCGAEAGWVDAAQAAVIQAQQRRDAARREVNRLEAEVHRLEQQLARVQQAIDQARQAVAIAAEAARAGAEARQWAGSAVETAAEGEAHGRSASETLEAERAAVADLAQRVAAATVAAADAEVSGRQATDAQHREAIIRLRGAAGELDHRMEELRLYESTEG